MNQIMTAPPSDEHAAITKAATEKKISFRYLPDISIYYVGYFRFKSKYIHIFIKWKPFRKFIHTKLSSRLESLHGKEDAADFGNALRGEAFRRGVEGRKFLCRRQTGDSQIEQQERAAAAGGAIHHGADSTGSSRVRVPRLAVGTFRKRAGRAPRSGPGIQPRMRAQTRVEPHGLPGCRP